MAFPQGINFRATAGYVTDGTNEDPELDNGGSGNSNYPRTTAQGNTVGWETAGSTYQTRNRNSGNDRRLAGINFNGVSGKVDYRIDLPSSGTYSIIVAMGDPSYAQTVDCELFDTSSSLGVLISGSTGAANSFKDQSNSTWTAANFFANTVAASKTFSTTIARFRCGSAGGTTGQIAHINIAASGSTAYSLNAASGSYAVTGADSAPNAALNLNAAAGSIAVSGANAGTSAALNLNASAGSMAVTGVAASVNAALNLNAQAGAIAVTGAAATLSTTAATNYTLLASPGAYGITGADASLAVALSSSPAADYGEEKKKKKRKVILDGKRFDLTEAQLAEVLLQSLRESPKPQKKADGPKPQPAKKAAQKPAKEAPVTYPAYPAFDRLWDYFIQTKQHEIAAFMREIVQRQLDDEEDVLILLASL